MSAPRGPRGYRSNIKPSTPQTITNGVAELVIDGLRQSRAASNPDGGQASLCEFLIKKASPPRGEPATIIQSKLEGDSLLIQVPESFAGRFLHLDGFQFAQATLKVTRLSSTSSNAPNKPSNPNYPATSGNFRQSHQPKSSSDLGSRISQPHDGRNGRQASLPNNRSQNVQFGKQPATESTLPLSSETKKLNAELLKFLNKRYDTQNHVLDLSNLGTDPDLQALGFSSSPEKFFTAIMGECDRMLKDPAQRKEMVPSITLANNGLTSVQQVIKLAITFPQLKNLDLSNNQLADTGALKFWRSQMRDLEHLILAGNPIDQIPNISKIMKQWYPKLQLYNSQPISLQTTKSHPQNLPTGPMETQPINQQPLLSDPRMQTSSNQLTALDSPAKSGLFAGVKEPSASSSPIPPHPEVIPGSGYGEQRIGKPEEVWMQERKRIDLSFATRMTLAWCEQCLVPNNWDLARSYENFESLNSSGQIPAEAFLPGV